MSVSQMSTLYATLAVLSQIAVVATALFWVLSRLNSKVRGWWREFRATVELVGIPFAFIVALVTTTGSLYFSEVANFVPCRLCWYQRICMYPLVVLLGIAWIRGREIVIRPYVLTLCAIGTVISSYHILLERYPSLEGTTCDLQAPCTLKWVEEFGYVTIPTMALSAFLLIATVMMVIPKGEVNEAAGK